jgi:diguanylate cyclase (GGDEF)-like protein
MPNLGERRESLEWLGTNKSIWTIDWPSQSLPLAIFTDVTTQQEELARLHTQLYTDPLTGEANRAGFEKALTELDAHVLTNYAIIFMDMNGFKAVNDTYGHDAGDTLLKIAGQRFRKVIGPEPVLARLGGDEFAIILRNCSAIDVVQDMCQELESSLGAEIDLGKCSVKVGVAAGFATQQSSAETTACVLRRADLAMYERKAFLKSRPPLASMPIHSPLPSLKA